MSSAVLSNLFVANLSSAKPFFLCYGLTLQRGGSTLPDIILESRSLAWRAFSRWSFSVLTGPGPLQWHFVDRNVEDIDDSGVGHREIPSLAGYQPHAIMAEKSHFPSRRVASIFSNMHYHVDVGEDISTMYLRISRIPDILTFGNKFSLCAFWPGAHFQAKSPHFKVLSFRPGMTVARDAILESRIVLVAYSRIGGWTKIYLPDLR